jgi:hypothetical protein
MRQRHTLTRPMLDFAGDALRKEGLNILKDAGAVLIADNDQVFAKSPANQANVSGLGASRAVRDRSVSPRAPTRLFVAGPLWES